MAKRQGDAANTSLPRSLKTLKGCRAELARLYRQVKLGEIDPPVARALVYIIHVLLASLRDHVVDDRLAEIEERLAEVKTNDRGNGSARPGARP
jgi:hypothetical protein